MRILSYKRGITLVETVVAVTILAAAIAGPMTLASQSLKASRDAKNELIATHLAEEGIEVIHSLRDNASAIDSTPTRTSWMVNLFAACVSACGIDSSGHMPPVWANDAIVPCVNPDCSDHMIFYNSTTGLYKQSIAALVSSTFFVVLPMPG